MLSPNTDETRSELHEKTNALLVQRLRVALWALLLVVHLFALGELSFDPHVLPGLFLGRRGDPKV